VNAYTVWATDTSGNRASSSSTFEIVDTTAPVLTGATAVPNPVEAGSPVQIRANATDLAGVASVRVEIRDPSNAVVGNFSMTLVAGTYQYSYTPTALGNYAFTITAADASSNTAVVTGTYASQDTTDPVADAGADANARVGLVVSLDGSGSTDNHGIVDYTWTFTEGTQTTTLTGVAPTHTFTAAGTYIITLNVTDEAGNYAVDTVTITVQVVAPAGGLAGWVISLILAIVVAVIVAALLLFMRRKKATAAPPPVAEGTAPPPETPEGPPPPPQE
jgi:PKD repeat protein